MDVFNAISRGWSRNLTEAENRQTDGKPQGWIVKSMQPAVQNAYLSVACEHLSYLGEAPVPRVASPLARSRVLARLASLAQIGELSRRLI